MIPSFTMGVPSSEYLPPSPEPRCVTHAPLSLPTLRGVILVRVE